MDNDLRARAHAHRQTDTHKHTDTHTHTPVEGAARKGMDIRVNVEETK